MVVTIVMIILIISNKPGLLLYGSNDSNEPGLLLYGSNDSNDYTYNIQQTGTFTVW